MKNWKTTLGGIVASIGLLMQEATDPKLKAIGWGVAALGVLIFGGNAKDHDVTGK